MGRGVRDLRGLSRGLLQRCEKYGDLCITKSEL